MVSEKVQECVDELCLQGCEVVRTVIRSLQAGQVVRGTEELTAEERHAVLAELQDIMSVYDRSD